MKNLFTGSLAAMVLLLHGCGNDRFDQLTPDAGDPDASCFVYRERDPASPLVLTRKTERHATRAQSVTLDDCLGRSFRTNCYPLENMENVGFPIIDIKKLERENPNWTKKLSLLECYTKSFSYSNFERYEQKSKVTEKINGEVSMKWWLFKASAKASYEETFSSSTVNESESIFGRLDAYIKDASYEITTISNKMNSIAVNYLSKDFRDDLHNSTPKELLDFYGPFVLTNFMSGGKATAVYQGTKKMSQGVETQEKQMDVTVEASFGGKVGVGAKFGIGNGFASEDSYSKDISKLRTSVKTLGGTYGHAGFTTARDIKSVSIDLTEWGKSLNDKSKHTIIGIGKGGLLPVTEILLEQNLKEYFTYYYETGIALDLTFTEPVLEVEYSYVPSSGASASSIFRMSDINIAVKLISRYGTYVHLLSKTYAQSMHLATVSAPEIASKVAEYYSGVYKVKTIVKKGGFAQSGAFVSFYEPVKKIDNTVYSSFESTHAFEGNLKKYVDNKNQMTYLLYSDGDAKYGYSIYTGNGDYLSKTYGMGEFIDSLPEVTVSYLELKKYKLFAL